MPTRQKLHEIFEAAPLFLRLVGLKYHIDYHLGLGDLDSSHFEGEFLLFFLNVELESQKTSYYFIHLYNGQRFYQSLVEEVNEEHV